MATLILVKSLDSSEFLKDMPQRICIVETIDTHFYCCIFELLR